MALDNMNRFVSINNFPPVKRQYILTKYYGDFTEEIKCKKFSCKPFYILNGYEFLTNVMFLPQNHKCYNHLNVFSETYFRIGKVDEKCEDTERLLCREFANEAKLVLKREVLLRMSETDSPELTSRLTRSLIHYGRIAKCIDDRTERIELTRFCLTTLYTKAQSDYEAVVEVLTNLCCPSRIYVEELYSQYTDLVTRYIFESCVKARFNFRNFILQHPANSPPEVNPVCPILENLLQGNCIFLKIFLEFGFERYPLESPASMRYEFLRISRFMSYQDIDIPEIHNDANNEHMQRYNLILETTYFICASLNDFDTRQWDAIARLIWKSVPDPFLTVPDVISFVAAGADEQIVERIIAQCHSEMFTAVFRDSSQPRCLKHLCRCVVGRALGRNFLLPLAIYTLQLPNTVVDYLDILTSEDDD